MIKTNACKWILNFLLAVFVPLMLLELSENCLLSRCRFFFLRIVYLVDNVVLAVLDGIEPFKKGFTFISKEPT